MRSRLGRGGAGPLEDGDRLVRLVAVDVRDAQPGERLRLPAAVAGRGEVGERRLQLGDRLGVAAAVAQRRCPGSMRVNAIQSGSPRATHRSRAVTQHARCPRRRGRTPRWCSPSRVSASSCARVVAERLGPPPSGRGRCRGTRAARRGAAAARRRRPRAAARRPAASAGRGPHGRRGPRCPPRRRSSPRPRPAASPRTSRPAGRSAAVLRLRRVLGGQPLPGEQPHQVVQPVPAGGHRVDQAGVDQPLRRARVAGQRGGRAVRQVAAGIGAQCPERPAVGVGQVVVRGGEAGAHVQVAFVELVEAGPFVTQAGGEVGESSTLDVCATARRPPGAARGSAPQAATISAAACGSASSRSPAPACARGGARRRR